jgi:hypothetical protein
VRRIQVQAEDPQGIIMSRQILIETLKDYFTAKGKFLTMDEYKEQADAPYRFQIVKRTVGSWSRLKGLIGDISAPVAAVAPKQPAPKPVAAKPAPAAPEAEAGATEANG